MSKNQNIKECILNASKNLFYEYGFEKTTTRMIAAEVDIFHSNIFYYFKNKKDILRLIFHEYFNNLHELTMKVNTELSNQELLLFYDYISLQHLEHDNKFRNLYYEATDIIFEVLYEGYIMHLYPKIDIHNKNTCEHKQKEYMMNIITMLSAEKEIRRLQDNEKLNITSKEIKEYMIKLNFKLLDIDVDTIAYNKKVARIIMEDIDFDQLNIFKQDYQISIKDNIKTSVI